jgi:hypothetical protein
VLSKICAGDTGKMYHTEYKISFFDILLIGHKMYTNMQVQPSGKQGFLQAPLLHSDKIVKTERDKRVQQFLVKKA